MGREVSNSFLVVGSARLNKDLRKAFRVLYSGLDLNGPDDQDWPNITNLLSKVIELSSHGFR
jgi:hypothetical protein